MKLLPQRKTLVGYARKITRAHSRVQLEILQQSFRERLTREEIEVLDYLCAFKGQLLDASERLGQLACEARQASLSTRCNLQRFVENGLRAQYAVDKLIAEHEEKSVR